MFASARARPGRDAEMAEVYVDEHGMEALYEAV